MFSFVLVGLMLVCVYRIVSHWLGCSSPLVRCVVVASPPDVDPALHGTVLHCVAPCVLVFLFLCIT